MQHSADHAKHAKNVQILCNFALIDNFYFHVWIPRYLGPSQGIVGGGGGTLEYKLNPEHASRTG